MKEHRELKAGDVVYIPFRDQFMSVNRINKNDPLGVVLSFDGNYTFSTYHENVSLVDGEWIFIEKRKYGS